MVSKEEAAELRPLEEVLAVVLGLGLREHGSSLGRLVGLRCCELRAHLKGLLCQRRLLEAKLVQIEVVGVAHDVGEVADAVLRRLLL